MFMKRISIVSAILCTLPANAQTYLISFAGSGASITVTTVKIENLTKGTTLTLNGTDILRLTGATGINSIVDYVSSEIKIYPNPMTDYSTLQIFPPVTGNAVISVLDMTGRHVAQIHSYLENYLQEFHLSGLNNGFYLINVKGNKYQFSGKLLSHGKSNGTLSIEKSNNTIKASDDKTANTVSKGTLATIDMEYSIGDRIKFTGMSGNYSTVKTDIPASDKTITFNFVACSDADNYNYPVVTIGTQVWMAENLRTTKYNDNSAIPLVTANTAWAALTTPGYCWYNNDATTYKALIGAIYNWYSVNSTSSGGKNVCPVGWHVPTDAQWSALANYLTINGFGYGGSGVGIAKSIAASTGWLTSSTAGTPGNDKASNNSSGFTALPNGLREWEGSFGSFSSYGFLWSSTESVTDFAWGRQMYSDVSTFDRNNIFKFYGAVVRCLRDN
jgi:uncharacterized protein (TIGR02145 family)